MRRTFNPDFALKNKLKHENKLKSFAVLKESKKLVFIEFSLRKLSLFFSKTESVSKFSNDGTTSRTTWKTENNDYLTKNSKNNYNDDNYSRNNNYFNNNNNNKSNNYYCYYY